MVKRKKVAGAKAPAKKSSSRKKSSKAKKTDDVEDEKFLYCPSCGYEAPFEENAHKDLYTLSTKLDHSSKDKTVVLSENADTLKVTEEEREANEDLFQPELEE
jgi:DNA-directed RNA polymerase subunit M/transcription elongation factor TFIIS